jgi:predicted metal-dependent peptidase
MNNKQEVRLKKAHIALMKHPETALYSGVMLMGKSEVSDDMFTAYTDGVNKRYSKPFLETIDCEPKLRGLVLHENLHVALKQIPRGKDMFKEDSKIANMAADFVVNDIIFNIKGTISGGNEAIVALPEGALYDPFFHNWNMREVYNYIRKENPQRGKGKGSSSGSPSDDDEQGDGNDESQNKSPSGGGKQDNKIKANGKEYDMGGDGFDEHDWESFKDITPEELKELSDGIDKALREGGMLAGRMGAKMPRAIGELLEPKIDWRDALRDFVSSAMKGKDEFTWRKMNKRQMANDIYMPSMENETIGDVIVAIDTSGSIGGAELTEFATELASICDLVQPEAVRVLWWDTMVHGEQVFKAESYGQIASLLKPLGGGGTHVGSVATYINEKKLNAECVIVFTDGYVEHDIEWNIVPPTLWMITQNKDLEVPCGKKVIFERE